MSVSSVSVLAPAVVLGVAGIAKLARPAGTLAAIRSVGLRAGQAAVEVLGVTELALATVVVLWAPWPAIAGLAVAYLCFASFSVVLLNKRGRSASCGCFGVADSPIHPVHVIVNVVVSGVVAAGLIWPPEPVFGLSIVEVFAMATVSVALLLAFTKLPSALARYSADTSPDLPPVTRR